MGTGEPVTAQQQCIGCSPPSPRPPVGGLKKSVGQNSLYWKEKSNFRIEGTLFGSNSPFRFLPQCQLFREASPHCLSKIAAPRTPQQSEFPLLIWDFFSFSMLHRVRPCHSAELPFEMGYPWFSYSSFPTLSLPFSQSYWPWPFEAHIQVFFLRFAFTPLSMVVYAAFKRSFVEVTCSGILSSEVLETIPNFLLPANLMNSSVV